MNTKENILSAYGLEEILCQMAEECNELAKECLKMRRVLQGTTDCEKAVVQANILEEMGDVINCIDVLTAHGDFPMQSVYDFAAAKMSRWTAHAADKQKAKKEDEAEKRKREMCMGCVLIARCRSDSQFDPPFFARCKEKK